MLLFSVCFEENLTALCHSDKTNVLSDDVCFVFFNLRFDDTKQIGQPGTCNPY